MRIENPLKDDIYTQLNIQDGIDSIEEYTNGDLLKWSIISFLLGVGLTALCFFHPF